VHEKAWNLLAELFNADVAFPRKVILRGINPIVDLFPQPLQLAKVNDITGDTPQQADKVVLLARSTTGQELADEIQRELGIPESAHMRLWIKARLFPTGLCAWVTVVGFGFRSRMKGMSCCKWTRRSHWMNLLQMMTSRCCLRRCSAKMGRGPRLAQLQLLRPFSRLPSKIWSLGVLPSRWGNRVLVYVLALGHAFIHVCVAERRLPRRARQRNEVV
jgi:hypothetical protein